MRDGNQNTIPENYLPKDYTAPGFRVQSITNLFNGNGANNGNGINNGVTNGVNHGNGK